MPDNAPKTGPQRVVEGVAKAATVPNPTKGGQFIELAALGTGVAKGLPELGAAIPLVLLPMEWGNDPESWAQLRESASMIGSWLLPALGIVVYGWIRGVQLGRKS